MTVGMAGGMAGRKLGALALALALGAALSGCQRNPYVLTECVNGKPVVERTLDVAPPNCES